MSWFKGGKSWFKGVGNWFGKHSGSIIGTALLPGIGTAIGAGYDKAKSYANALLSSQSQANRAQNVANYLNYKQYQAQVDANNEARAEALENRKNTIDAQRKQILGNQRKSYGSGNAISSGNGFSLLDNNKTLG